MLYSTVIVALFLMAGSLAQKPQHICQEECNSVPDLQLGGYKVPESEYATGIDMVNALWRQHGVKVFAAKNPSDFFSQYPSDPNRDDGFAFETKDGYWQGIGIQGHEFDSQNEISDHEGLFVDLGKEVKEFFFGVRGLDNETDFGSGVPESGLVLFSKNGNIFGSQFFHLTEDRIVGTDDGEHHFHVVSDVALDAFLLITLNEIGQYGHEFFVEYADVCTCSVEPSIKGDPHIETWSGIKYDFHGVCDLVLLHNPGFEQGLGMHIHVRTKRLKQFSYVSSAVLRIGDETLEVMGDIHENLYWLNKQPNENLEKGISGYPITYRKVNSKQHNFTVELGDNKSIVIKTFKKFVRVSFVGATQQSFGTSRGLLGSFGSGKMMGRDNVTVFENTDEFGQEWQVLTYEDMLFHNVEGPQAPAKCEMPVASNLRRRLAESQISEDDAKIACARVNREDFDLCVFDVMATGDVDVFGAY
jgi:hypothetical protein